MNGTIAVAVSGIASVIHHAAISTTSPATGHASGGMPAGAGRASVSSKAMSPTRSPIRLTFIPRPPDARRP